MTQSTQNIAQERSASSMKFFYVGLVALALAFVLTRAWVMGFSLPYLEHYNEPNYFYASLEWLGRYDNAGFYDNFFSLYIAQGALILSVLPDIKIQDFVLLMRGINLLYSLGTLLLVVLIAKRWSNTQGALLAGALWVFTPLMLLDSLYAVPDALVYVSTILALYTALHALDTDKLAFLYASTISGLIAVLTKYNSLFALIPCGVVMLVWLFRQRARALPHVALCLLFIGVVGLGLMARVLDGTYGIRAYTQDELSLSALLDLSKFWNNFTLVLYPIGIFASLLLLALSAPAWAWRTRHESLLSRCQPLIAFAMWVANAFIMNTFLRPLDLDVIRYVLPSFGLVCVLLGVGCVAVVAYVPTKWRTLGTALVAGGLLLPLLAPFAEQLRLWRVTPVQLALHQWFNQNHALGNILVDDYHHKTFNPDWGGLRLTDGWANWYEGNIRDMSLEAWRASDFGYIVLPLSEWNELQDTPYAELLPLRNFVPDNVTLRGQATTVLRVPPIQHPTQDVVFGGVIAFKGYDVTPPIEGNTLGAQRALSFTLYWQALGHPNVNYSTFLHLVKQGEERPLAQVDGAPSRRDTSTWDVPNEILISRPMVLELPALDKGDYEVLIGVYDSMTGVRLTQRDQDRAVLLRFSVP
jgi:hypothetical protein